VFTSENIAVLLAIGSDRIKTATAVELSVRVAEMQPLSSEPLEFPT